MLDAGDVVVLHAVHLSVEGVSENLAQLLGVPLRFARFCGVKNRGLDAAGQSPAEQFRRKLHGSEIKVK